MVVQRQQQETPSPVVDEAKAAFITMFCDAIKLHQPDPAVLAELPDTQAKPLFPPEVAQRARLLKKLWAIAQLDIQWREE